MAAFLGVPSQAGERVTRRVPVGELADGSPIELPVMTIGGTRPGPTLYIQAGIHGDEMTGIEICRQAIATLKPDQIKGTVVAVPVANVPSHLTRTRGYLQEERWLIDINRIFPGNPAGLLTERIASVLFESFVRRRTSRSTSIPPWTAATSRRSSTSTRTMTTTGRSRSGRGSGRPSGRRTSITRPAAPSFGTSDLSRSLSAQADLAGIPMIVAEMGESRRVSTQYVPIGVQGIRNALHAMGMLDGDPPLPVEQRSFTEFKIVHAGRGGGLRLAVDIGDEVKSGQASRGDRRRLRRRRVEQLEAPHDGFVLRAMRLGASPRAPRSSGSRPDRGRGLTSGPATPNHEPAATREVARSGPG